MTEGAGLWGGWLVGDNTAVTTFQLFNFSVLLFVFLLTDFVEL